MMRHLVPLLLLAIADARIDFHESALFDMNDFKGTRDYPIKICQVGCRVYLTYFNDAQCLGDQDNGPFTIVAGDNSTTFYDLNKLREEDGQKGYFEIPVGTEEFTIHNPNGNFAARPLALWVVQENKLLNNLGVYEAEDGAQIDTDSREVVLMGVEPFTVNAAIEGDYSLTAKTSPYEMMTRDECEYVFTFNNTIGPAFSVPFNSPLITIACNSGDEKFRMKLTIDHEYPTERSIDASGYFASPGYIGCGNATFRSESYNYGLTTLNETFLVDGDSIRNVSFYGDLNTDDYAPILLYDMDTDDEPMSIVGSKNDNTSTWEYELITSKFSIHWDALHWKNESYMIRYEVNASGVLPTQAPKTTVATTTLLKTSPTVPTVPVKETSPTVPTVPPTTTTTVPSATVEVETTVVTESASTLTSTSTEQSTTSFSSMRSTIVAIFTVFVVLLL